MGLSALFETIYLKGCSFMVEFEHIDVLVVEMKAGQ